MSYLKYVLPILAAGMIGIGFQNCSDVDFSSAASVTPSNTNPEDIVESEGVDGGHFDLDTATEVYEDNRGDTNKHQHEYDDRYNTNVANFFDLIDDDFDEVDEVIAQDQAFYIRITNGDLTQSVAIEINATKYATSVTQHGPFSLSGVAGTTRLSNFRALVATDAITNAGLVSSQPSCVIDNRISQDNRYRNGSLVIQAIPADQIDNLDARGVAAENAALLWEAMIFWHEPRGRCR